MDKQQGYFSLIQYSEYPERAEFVNIGVVLFFEMAPRVLVKFVDRPKRIQQVFHSNLGLRFEDIKSSLSERLVSEFSNNWSKDSLYKFIDMRSSKVRLSPPRSVLVSDPKILLDKLFSELVGELPRASHVKRASTKLMNAFKTHDVERYLEKPKPVKLPYDIEIKAPYAYQNGSYNLIKAVRLQGEPDEALRKVSPDMIGGKLLYDETVLDAGKRLVVVGDAEDQNSDFMDMLSDQMRKHDVLFYRLDAIGPLVQDIRRSSTIHDPALVE